MSHKVYFVQVVDIMNNFYEIGYFKSLDDAIPEINNFISNDQFKLIAGDLKEYASTFNMCFDVPVLYDLLLNRNAISEDMDIDEDDELSMQIRGYIYDSKALLKEIKKVCK